MKSGGPCGAVLVGGGAAGTALLIAASRYGMLEGLARDGLTILEQGGAIGGGGLHAHAINGDSTAKTFLSAVAPEAGPDLAALADHPAARAIAARLGPDEGTPVPLAEVAAFIDVLGAALAERVVASGGAVMLGRTAVDTRRRADGMWVTRYREPDGATAELVSLHVVLTTGARQESERLEREMLAGQTLAALGQGRLMASGDVLAHGGAEAVAARLRGVAAPRVVVVGSSTSAAAACRVLLGVLPCGVTWLHRRRLRLFYPSAADALADGYADFGPEDICPVSLFVNRLGGLRMEARDLARQALGVGGRVPDPGLRLHHIAGPDEAAAARMVAQADLVVHALGYRPLALPVLDAAGRSVALHAGRLVDAEGRVRDDTGQGVPGLFALGLAAGFVPSGALGGEPSFSGQANGLWLWQNDAGAMIASAIGRREAQARAA